MKSHIYITPIGEFTIPQQWKELLGEECLSLTASVSERLKILKIDKQCFMSLCKQSNDFVSWYDAQAQRRLSIGKKAKITIEKSKKTMMQKYGCDNPMKSAGLRARHAESLKEYTEDEDRKLKATSKRLFTLKTNLGVSAPSQSDQVRLKIKESRKNIDKSLLKERTVSTNIKRYGVAHPMQLKEFRDKARATNLQKYGKLSKLAKSWPEIIAKLSEFQITPLDTYDSCVPYEQHQAKCNVCGNVFTYHWTYMRTPTSCPRCNKCSTVMERKLADDIENLGVVVERHNKSILEGNEIDIYLPTYKIGIEVNGALTHNSGFNPFPGARPKDKYYHAIKTTNASLKGIKLIHVWEHWGYDKIFDFIKSVLGIEQTKLQARKLKLVEDPQGIQDFFDSNHLHGHAPFEKSFSLVSEEGEVIQAITLIRNKSAYEIKRLATKRNFRVVSGFERLFNHVKHYATSKGVHLIVSYAYRDITPIAEASVYARHGFAEVAKTGPMLSFWADSTIKTLDGEIIVRRGIYSREKFQKHKLAKFDGTFVKGKIFHFVRTETAEENLKRLEVYPIYNSGCYKFEFYINSGTNSFKR